MKYMIVMIAMLWSCGHSFAQQPDRKEMVRHFWETFTPAGKNVIPEVIKEKTKLARQLEGNADLMLENEAAAIRYVAKRLRNGEGEGIKVSGLKKLLKGVDLTSPQVAQLERLSGFIEDYFALKFIGEEALGAENWKKAWANSSKEGSGNGYDYKRYKAILETSNAPLITAYLECLRLVFRYDGYTEGLAELRPLVEANFPEGELKKEILGLYESYYHLRKGAVAPAFTLKDFRGKEHALADYRGKVLVVDVWATWCGGCIQKLPEFMKIREAYKDRQDIEFITISIDDAASFKSWKYALPRLKLMEVTNLIASRTECSFGKDYNITGIPRYFLIDREGKIVSVYAPTPGNELKKMIDNTLNHKE